MTAKCSRCTAACQVYQASGDPRDIPCHRSELLFRVYRRYFTLAGEVKARLYDSFVLTDEYIDEMAEEYWRCTACKRCKSSCPMGIDHGMITHLARWILAEIDVVPKAMVVSVREQLEGDTKNTSAIPAIAMKDTCEFLEEEIEEEYPGAGIKFPMDVEDAEYVFFPAVSDYLMEAETLMGNAAMLHVTNTSWTIGTTNFDGIDYGLFYSDRMWERIIKAQVAEIKRLGRQEDADRRVWPRIPRRQGGHAELHPPGRTDPRGQHHGTGVREVPLGGAEAEGERHQGANDLSRPLQHRPGRDGSSSSRASFSVTSARTSWR